MTTPSKILIAPLDWGLGHTTRCIPVIRYLLQQGHKVYVAAEGASAKLLLENFPSLPVLPLAGYRIRYSRTGNMFTAGILMQVPKILAAIRKEHRWLQEQQQLHRFDLILSDNRYGLYHRRLPCVILTHQLQIMSGKGELADSVLRRLHYRMLQRFHTCWVVDEEERSGFSGKLAHPLPLPRGISYTGLLSQFSGKVKGPVAVEPNRILVLLSGPEPMRSQLERIVLEQIGAMQMYRFIVVAGNPLGKMVAGLPAHVTYYTHLHAMALLPELQQAALVICRSGYSTLMDLAVCGKKALLIPTPGQTEQEYLSEYLREKEYFNISTQEKLDLATQIPLSLSSGFKPGPVSESRIGSLLDAIL